MGTWIDQRCTNGSSRLVRSGEASKVVERLKARSMQVISMQISFDCALIFDI